MALKELSVFPFYRMYTVSWDSSDYSSCKEQLVKELKGIQAEMNWPEEALTGSLRCN